MSFEHIGDISKRILTNLSVRCTDENVIPFPVTDEGRALLAAFKDKPEMLFKPDIKNLDFEAVLKKAEKLYANMPDYILSNAPEAGTNERKEWEKLIRRLLFSFAWVSVQFPNNFSQFLVDLEVFKKRTQRAGNKNE